MWIWLDFHKDNVDPPRRALTDIKFSELAEPSFSRGSAEVVSPPA